MSGYDQPMNHHLRCRGNVNSLHGVGDSCETFAAMKASIVAHPQYPNLVRAYIDCHKVIAPPETVDRLVQLWQVLMPPTPTSAASIHDSKDPELDQFMEAYYNMLVKLREKLTTPLQEALEFIRSVETQLNQLTNPPRTAGISGGGSSDNGYEISHGGDKETGIDPRSKDPELKNYLRSKYRGHLSTLKQEFSMKKKKGKLPKEARHKLLTWWQLHHKWPYPSESDKVALEKATGLDHKQINNWFINQRKRHWKPSHEGEFMVMDDSHNPHNAPLYMDGHYLGHDGPHRLRH